MFSYRNILILLAQLLSLASFGWGKEGHIMTAEVAKEHLSKTTQDSLAFYLGDMSLAQASTWMDEIKKDTSLDYLKPLHYINIEPGKEYDPASKDNIISELNKVIAELKDRSHHTRQEIALDLKILIHLTGDIHQPLHVGYGSDRGGNSVKLLVVGDSSNLHRLWDSEIIKRKHITLEKLKFFDNKESEARAADLNILDWMNESRRELKDVYDYKGNIDEKYIDKNAKLVGKDLFIAGLRLANLLNSIFADTKKNH